MFSIEAEARYQKLFIEALDMIHIVSREGRILDANPAELETLGYPREELIGRPLLEIIHPDYRDKTATALGKALRGETIRGYETALLTRGGEPVFVEVNAVPEREEGEVTCVRGILRNVTEKKKSAEREQRLHEELQNAHRRLQEEKEVIGHLLAIAQAAIHATDVHQMAEKVGRRIQRICRCDLFLLYLWDEEQRNLRPAYSQGLLKEHLSFWQTQTLDGKQPYFREILKMREIRLWRPGEDWGPVLPPFGWISDFRSFVWIPLRRKTGGLGLMVCGSREIRELSERERQLWEGIAYQISVALEENRLHRDSLDQTMRLSIQMETLRALREIDRSILSARDSGEILETAIRSVTRLLPCDFASITLVGPTREELHQSVELGLPFLPQGIAIPLSETTAAEIIQNARSQYFSSLAGMEGLPPHERRFLREGFLSLLRVPLWQQGEVIGTLNIGARRPSAFTPENADNLGQLADQVSVALENARLVADIKELFMGTVQNLSSALEGQNPWLQGHSDRVVDLAVRIAREMARPEEEIADLRIAGWLHDIGMIGIYPKIADKAGLTPEEKAALRAHTDSAAATLASIRPLAHILPWIRSHHEWWNGTGYPEGLREEAIPLPARILAVADAFEAMTAERPYRPTLGKDRAVIELQRYSGVQFDARVVEAFLRVVPGGD